MRLARPSCLLAARSAFTLLEVALAMGLLCGMAFILLQITSTNLRIARALQRTTVDASSLAAEISLTNQLAEGTETGDFGDLHPDHTWRRDITLMGTNGLFEIRFEVYNNRGREPLRCAVRSALRSQGPAPITAVSSASINAW